MLNTQLPLHSLEASRLSSSKLAELNKLLYVKRVEFEFFNDPLFREEKYARYQEKVRGEIAVLCNQISAIADATY